jgi:FkbM family methyltransferase
LSGSRLVDLRIPKLQQRLQMFVHGPHDKHVSQQLSQHGVWEPYETSLVQLLLNPGDVFVDVGANVGYFTVLAASLVGDSGHVFAFEPDPENFRLLVKNTEHNNLHARVEAVQAGLAQQDRAGTLYLSGDNLGDHQIYPGEPGRQQVGIELFNGSPKLTRLMTATQKSNIDLIKIDTQGSEFAVITGLIDLINTLQTPPTILIELTPFSLRQAGSSGRALIELLATFGQDMWIVDHIEHRLVLSTAAALATWCDNVDACEGDEGFMNILIGAGT